ncbi:hypothetical protein L596_021732 [Steinernema carpocapsae]|uniref:Beta-Casp domain-containing protein n=1 Tax=Steinernema carpocapsae TaxID=34508 RepID=A0A4U5MJZ2_STECR|nr:hypothetical protein L596_021732 [Steinernema carpocapsae]
MSFQVDAPSTDISSDVLTFTPLGSGQEVGRSCHVLSFKGKKIMLDCGVHPGMQSAESLPLIDFVECESIDIMLITHFHLDHCGALPWLLQKTAFRGRCFMTHATKAIYRMLIGDFIKIAKFGGAEGNNKTLFTEDDLERTMEKIECIDYHEQKEVNGIRFWCYVAGHVLGACMFMIEIDSVRLLYTGDFSRQEDRHLCSAELPSVKPDILVCESTYGTQVHEPRDERERRFTSFVYDVVMRGGRCLIPAFALGRAQELLLILDEFWEQHQELHEIPVYYASSLAKKCMAVYQTFVGAMNEHVQNQIGSKSNPFVFKHVSNLKSMDHFDDVGPCVVLASPGMLQNGLSRDLFEMWCPDPKNGCIIAGYCVEGTLAKHILSEPEEILSLTGQKLPMRLQVGYMSFSAHTDYEQTSEFIRLVKPAHLILVHGEMTEMNRLKAAITRQYEDDKNYQITVHNPKNTESVSLTFHGERNAKVVGQMAAKLSVADNTISGILLRRNFNYHLMDPNELSSYSDLSNSRLQQMQALKYNGSINLLIHNLRQLSTDLMLSKPEKEYHIEGMNGAQPNQVIEIFKGSINVLIYRDLEMLVLTWMSNPVNDMFSDATVTAILHAQTNPIPDKYLPKEVLPDSRLKHLIADSLREVCGEKAEITVEGEEVHVKVDGHEATVKTDPISITCTDPLLQHLIAAVANKATQVTGSVVNEAVDLC